MAKLKFPFITSSRSTNPAVAGFISENIIKLRIYFVKGQFHIAKNNRQKAEFGVTSVELYLHQRCKEDGARAPFSQHNGVATRPVLSRDFTAAT